VVNVRPVGNGRCREAVALFTETGWRLVSDIPYTHGQFAAKALEAPDTSSGTPRTSDEATDCLSARMVKGREDGVPEYF